MSSINLKINKIVNHFFNGNNSEFAKKVGTSEANIRNYREKTIPKFDFIERLFEYLPEINPEWLLTGNGKMLKDMSIDEVNETLPIYSNVDYKEKYYELLEENRELRIKMERIEDKHNIELEKLKETHQKHVQEIEKCKKELEKFRKEKNNTTMLPV